MLEVRRERPDEVVIRMSETLDAGAAARLSTCLGDVPADARVVVDFSRTRAFHGVGIASVAMRLAGLQGLVVRGLGLHHRRLLRYCGVGAADPAQVADLDD